MLLTHTSGITYGFDTRGVANKVDRIFNEKLRACPAAKKSLATFAEDFLPSVPLIFQPGSSWFYGYNTDVLGRIVEIVSGMSLEAFLRSRIFEKIGMTDFEFSFLRKTAQIRVHIHAQGAKIRYALARPEQRFRSRTSEH